MAETPRRKRKALLLRYEAGDGAAPVVTAKGQGLLAEKIVALAVLFFAQSLRSGAGGPASTDAAPRRPARVAAIAIGLLACLAVLPWAGFVVAVAAYLAFLVGWVERRSRLETVLVPIGTSVALWLVFKVWLRVPLPAGPWGF